MERGLLTPLKQLRRQVFVELARVAFESNKDTIKDDIEAIPYKITPGDKPLYRESIWRERAICSERVRLAMGLSLRPEDAPVHVTSGLSGSDIADKYYEPPLMQVIPSACAACPPNKYQVTDNCRGCVAHPCTAVCPKQCISVVNGRAVIDQSRCIKCGKCKSVCPYDAIAHQLRPCAEACGVKAIESDDLVAQPVSKDEMVFIAPISHPLAGQRVALHELKDEPFILREGGSGTREIFVRMMRERQLSFHEAWTCNNSEAIKNAVMEGHGVSLISNLLVEKELREGRMGCIQVSDVPPILRHFRLIRHKDKYLSPALNSFIALCGQAE